MMSKDCLGAERALHPQRAYRRPELCQKHCDTLQIERTHGFSNEDYKLVYLSSTLIPRLQYVAVRLSSPRSTDTSFQRVQVRQLSLGDGCPNLNCVARLLRFLASELPVLGHGMPVVVLAEARHFTCHLIHCSLNLVLSSHHLALGFISANGFCLVKPIA